MLVILAGADGAVESSHILHVWSFHDQPSPALIEGTEIIYGRRPGLIPATAGPVLKKLDGTSSTKPTRELLDTIKDKISRYWKTIKLSANVLVGIKDPGILTALENTVTRDQSDGPSGYLLTADHG